MRFQLQQFATVTATPRTAWTFAVLADGEGTDTTVELTLGDRSARVAATLAGLLAYVAQVVHRGATMVPATAAGCW